MMKRLFSFLLALLLPLSALAEEESIVTYLLPEGAQVLTIDQAEDWLVPDGLAPMYDLMQIASRHGDVYLARMPMGRALVSVSCTAVDKPLTAQELLALWPQIALNIARQGVAISADEDCACVDEIFGRELLSIETVIEADGLTLNALGFAFCRGFDLLELWAVWPEDEALATEADVEAMTDFLASFDFDDAPIAISTQPYRDPAGRFTLQVPMDAVLITKDTEEEVVAHTEVLFTSANPEGAEQIFEEMMDEVLSEDALMLFTADMQGVVQIYASAEPDFAGVTTAQLALLADPIRQNLEDVYGLALNLEEPGATYFSGQEHTWLTYWIRTGDCDMQLDVMACVLGDNWLYEVDVYCIDGDQITRAMLHSLLSQTLAYTAHE